MESKNLMINSLFSASHNNSWFWCICYGHMRVLFEVVENVFTSRSKVKKLLMLVLRAFVNALHHVQLEMK